MEVGVIFRLTANTRLDGLSTVIRHRQFAQLIGTKAARTLIARCALDVWRQRDGLLFLLMLLAERMEEVGRPDVLPAWSPWMGLAPPVVPHVIQRQ